MDLPIGDLLVTMGHISKQQLADALDLQKESGTKLGQILVAMGVITEEEILKALSIKFVIPMVDLKRTEVSETVIKMVSLTMVRRFSVMPISRSGNTLCVAI